MELTPEKVKKVRFFEALKGTCCGMDIFARLRYHSILRSLWHLFLISGLCSLLIAVVGKKNIESEIDPQMAILNEYTGGFVNKKDGIFPKKNAEKSFDFLLDDKIKVVYTPVFKDIDFREILPNGVTWFWVPQGVFSVVKFNDKVDGNVMFFDFASLKKMQSPNVSVFENNKALDNYMKKAIASVEPCDYTELPIIDSEDIKFGYLSMQFLSYWVQYFWQLLITSLIFAIFYAITGVGRINSMNFKAFFAVSIYAGFPAMLISVFFESFKLPFVSYHTVFSFGWLIYLLIILNSFIKKQEVNN